MLLQINPIIFLSIVDIGSNLFFLVIFYIIMSYFVLGFFSLQNYWFLGLITWNSHLPDVWSSVFFCAEPCPVLTDQLQILALYIQLLCLYLPFWYFLYWNVKTTMTHVIHYNIQILFCRTAIWARHFSGSICKADCSYLNILFALIELLSIYYSFFLPFVFLILNSNLVLKNACTPPSLLSYKNLINLLPIVLPRALMKWLHSTRLQTDFTRTLVDIAFQHIVFQSFLHPSYRGVRKEVIFLFGWGFVFFFRWG